MTAKHRVGAICDSDTKQVRLYGFGVYVGDEVPPPDVRFFGMPLERPNPKIALDDGKIVWGCECWWGPEERIRKVIGDREIVLVDIEKHRTETTNG